MWKSQRDYLRWIGGKTEFWLGMSEFVVCMFEGLTCPGYQSLTLTQSPILFGSHSCRTIQCVCKRGSWPCLHGNFLKGWGGLSVRLFPWSPKNICTILHSGWEGLKRETREGKYAWLLAKGMSLVRWILYYNVVTARIGLSLVSGGNEVLSTKNIQSTGFLSLKSAMQIRYFRLGSFWPLKIRAVNCTWDWLSNQCRAWNIGIVLLLSVHSM